MKGRIMIGRRWMQRVPHCLTMIAIIGVSFTLGACSDLFSEEEKRLPGKRIAVMLADTDADPDPRLADLQVKLPPPYVNKSWPQSGGFPDHAMHHLMLGEKIQRVWKADIGAASEGDQRILQGPLIAEGRLYSMDRDYEISAFDAQTGKTLWRKQMDVPEDDEEAFGGGLAYADGLLYASTGYAKVSAFNASNGQEIWRANLTGPARAAPTVAEARVVVVTIDNRVTAFDADTGEEAWTHAGFTEVAGLLGAASPAIADNTAIIPYSSGEVYAVRVANGRVSWSDSLTSARRVDALSALADIRARPVIDRGVVFVVSHSGRMLAIDLRTGSRIWDRRIASVQSPWVAGEFVFVITVDQALLAITRRGGRVRWARYLPNFEDPEDLDDPISWVGPVLANDRLIVANNIGEVWAVSPYDGTPLGQIDVDDPVSVTPRIANGMLYIQTDAGSVYAYR